MYDRKSRKEIKMEGTIIMSNLNHPLPSHIAVLDLLSYVQGSSSRCLLSSDAAKISIILKENKYFRRINVFYRPNKIATASLRPRLHLTINKSRFTLHLLIYLYRRLNITFQCIGLLAFQFRMIFPNQF